MTRHPFLPPARRLAREAGPIIVESGMILAMGIAGYALYCAVCPIEAYASELSPWNKPIISGTVAWLILGYGFCAGLALYIVLKIFAIAPRDDDEPYRNKDDWGM